AVGGDDVVLPGDRCRIHRADHDTHRTAIEGIVEHVHVVDAGPVDLAVPGADHGGDVAALHDVVADRQVVRAALPGLRQRLDSDSGIADVVALDDAGIASVDVDRHVRGAVPEHPVALLAD